MFPEFTLGFNGTFLLVIDDVYRQRDYYSHFVNLFSRQHAVDSEVTNDFINIIDSFNGR